MNKTIALNELAGNLARAEGISHQEAVRFISEYFGAITRAVAAGTPVTITDFGTFRNAGEEAVFEPDARFAEAVNEPFAMFTPVVIDSDAALSILDDVSTVNGADKKDEPEVRAAETPTVPENESATVSTVIEAVDSEGRNEVDVDTQLTPESPAPRAAIPPPFRAESFPGNEIIQDALASCTVPEANLSEQADGYDAPEAEASVDDTESDIYDYEYEEPAPNVSRSKFVLWIVIALIVGLAIGIAAGYTGHDRLRSVLGASGHTTELTSPKR